MTESTPGVSPDFDAVAAQWIARRDHGLTAAEKAELDRWLAAPRHAEAFARCEALWGALPSLKRLPARDLDALMVPRPAPSGVNGRRRLAPVFWFTGGTAPAAAGIALLFVLRAPVAFPRAEPVVQIYSAPVGAEARVALPDGSVAILHRGSQISFGSFPAARRVRLLAGQAHFTVAKTSAQPFVVHAGQVAVRDLGTAFDVRLDPDRVAVLVTEGRVEVCNASVPTLLTVGQQAVVQTALASSPVEVGALAPPEVEQALAWKSRRLAFDRTPLAEAVAELNRYNVRQLSLADASLSSVLIAGGVQSDNLDGFVRLLESGFGLVAEDRGKEIVLRKSK